MAMPDCLRHMTRSLEREQVSEMSFLSEAWRRENELTGDGETWQARGVCDALDVVGWRMRR